MKRRTDGGMDIEYARVGNPIGAQRHDARHDASHVVSIEGGTRRCNNMRHIRIRPIH